MSSLSAPHLATVAATISLRPMVRASKPHARHRSSDHRYCLGVYRFNDCIRRGCQKAVDVVWPRNGLGLGAPVAFELRPYTGEGNQRPILTQGKPNNILFLRERVWFGRI